MGSTLRTVLFATALLIGGSASAQTSCPSNDVCFTIGAVTTYVGGTPIPATKVVSYRIYRETSPGTFVSALTTLSLTPVLVNEPRGLQCYVATAIVDNVESARTSKVCKTVRLPAPTDGKIEAPSDGAIEPRR